jgi:uncharacterized protein YndB with AHSA1/START domain
MDTTTIEEQTGIRLAEELAGSEMPSLFTTGCMERHWCPSQPSDSQEVGPVITVEAEIVINCPVEVVFAAITDIASLPKWQPSITDSRQTTPGPVGVGTRGINARTVMGQRVETTFEVTAFIPNQTLAVRSLTGPVSYELRYTLTPVAGGTQLHEILQGEPKGFFKVAEPLLANMLKKEFAEDLARLKALLER